MKQILSIVTLLALVAAATADRTVMVNSNAVVTQPTNFAQANASNWAPALAPYLTNIAGGSSDWSTISNKPGWITGATWQTNPTSPIFSGTGGGDVQWYFGSEEFRIYHDPSSENALRIGASGPVELGEQWNHPTVRSALGLSSFATNLDGGAVLKSGDGTETVDVGDSVNFYAPLGFVGTNASANKQATLDGFGLGASWLTNSNAPVTIFPDQTFTPDSSGTNTLVLSPSRLQRVTGAGYYSGLVTLPTNNAHGDTVIIRALAAGLTVNGTYVADQQTRHFLWDTNAPNTGGAWVRPDANVQTGQIVTGASGTNGTLVGKAAGFGGVNGQIVSIGSTLVSAGAVLDVVGVKSGGALLGTPMMADGASGSAFGGSTFRLGSSVLLGGTNTLEQVNGTNAQAFYVYNTSTTATNYERGVFRWTNGALVVGTEKGTAGGTARSLRLQTDGTTRVTIDSGGNVFFANAFLAGDTWYFGHSNRSIFKSPSDGVLTLFNWNENDFNRIQLGGTTTNFPALKRSGATVQVRTATDGGFAVLDAQLRAQGAAPTTSSDTGTPGDLRYDSGFIYVCVATNTWRRMAITNW